MAAETLSSLKWLTVEQACLYSGKSAPTLKRKAKAGLITGYKPVGSQWVFDRESIDNYYTPPISKRAFDIVRSLRK